MSSLPRPDYVGSSATKSWTLTPDVKLWASATTGWYMAIGSNYSYIDITEEQAHELLRAEVDTARKRLADMHVTPTF